MDEEIKKNNMLLDKSVADIIYTIQDFMNSEDPELRELLKKDVTQYKDLYLEGICKNIKRAIDEGFETLISQSAVDKYVKRFVKKEPNKDELKILEQTTYINGIQSSCEDLEIVALINVLIRAKTKLSYRVTLTRAFKESHKIIKEIQKETKCNSATTGFLLLGLLHNICSTAYDIYHPEKFKSMNEFTEKFVDMQNGCIEKIRLYGNAPEGDKYRKEMQSLQAELGEKTNNYAIDALGFDEIETVAKSILQSIFKEPVQVSSITNKPYLPFYANGDGNSLIYNITKANKNSVENKTGNKKIATYNYSKEEGTIITDLSELKVANGRGKEVKITDGHKKIFLYACNLMNRSKSQIIEFNYDEFLKLKGSQCTHQNRQAIRDKLMELNTIYWKIKRKGHETELYKLMTPDKLTPKGAEIRIGDWTKGDLGYNVYIDETAFTYNEPKASIGGAFSLSQKLCNEIKMNWDNSKRIKDGWLSLKIEGIIKDILGFSDETIRKYGFSWIEERLNDLLEEIRGTKDKWEIKYRKHNHDSQKEFFEDYLEFKNKELVDLYKDNMEKATQSNTKKLSKKK